MKFTFSRVIAVAEPWFGGALLLNRDSALDSSGRGSYMTHRFDLMGHSG